MSDMQIIDHDESIMKVHRENATWLGVVDVVDHSPVTLTIKRVFRYRQGVFAGGRKQNGQAVEFQETTKLLPLNATNTFELFKHGKTPKDFVGKKMEITVQKLERSFQGSTHGLRITGITSAS